MRALFPCLVSILTLALPLASGCVTGSSKSAAEPSDRADVEVTGGRIYRGADGQKVEMGLVKASKGHKKEALIRISNAQSEWDGLILRCEVIESTGKVDVKSPYHSGYVAIAGRGAGGWWGVSNSLNYEVYAPGLKDDIKIAFDQKASDDFDFKAFAAEYDPAKDPGAGSAKPTVKKAGKTGAKKKKK